MEIYKARAFTYPEKIDGKEVIGNPASIVVCKENFPSQEEMSRIATEEKQPMTAFIKKQKDNLFDVKYFTPSGEEFIFCGHASLIIASIIKQHFGFQKALLNLIKIKKVIDIEIDNQNLAKISIPVYGLEKIAPNINYINNLNINLDDVLECFYCKKLKDYIIKVKDNKVLKSIYQNRAELSIILKKDKIRGLFVTSISDKKNINYEVRIFAPHAKIDEDISCGSANCSLLNIWQKENLQQYKVLCPFNIPNKIGGYEIIDYNYGDKKAIVGGYVA